MTLSERNLGLGLAFWLFCGVALAADPPAAEMSAARAAIADAERAQPRGPAADLLSQAVSRFGQAQDAMGRKKYRDALRLAESARAQAELARAKARLANARDEIEEKSARNADLRRQLLVLPEDRR